jgi:hypothetical protein
VKIQPQWVATPGKQTSNEIFSPSNKIHREVGRAKELSAPLWLHLGFDQLILLGHRELRVGYKSTMSVVVSIYTAIF